VAFQFAQDLAGRTAGGEAPRGPVTSIQGDAPQGLDHV
jgi:hypothetical protein